MKKFLALSLAALMVMGLATVGFATAPTSKGNQTGDAIVGIAKEFTASDWFTVVDDAIDAYSLENAPATASIDNTGKLTYTPASTDGTSVTMDVYASASGAKIASPVVLTVTVSANNAPTTTSPSIPDVNKYVGETYSVNVSNWFSDADTGDVLTYTANAGEIKNLNTLEFKPTAAGNTTITVTATDKAGNTATQTVKVVATAAKLEKNGTPPTGNTATVGTAITPIETSGWFTYNGPSSKTLTYGFDGTVPSNASINSATGQLIFTPTATTPNSITVKLTATDASHSALTETQTITFTISAAPVAPTINGANTRSGTATPASADGSVAVVPYGPQSIKTWFNGTVTGYATSSPTGNGNWDVADIANGNIKYTPTGTGNATIKVKALNGSLESPEITLTVTVGAVPADIKPEVSTEGENASGTIKKGTPLSFNVAKYFDNKGVAIDYYNATITKPLTNGGSLNVSQSASGDFIYTPSVTLDVVADIEITVTATNVNGKVSDPIIYKIAVTDNTTPPSTSTSGKTPQTKSTSGTSAITINANANWFTGTDVITGYKLELDNPSYGTITTNNATTGEFTYTPSAAAASNSPVTLRMYASNGNWSTDYVTFNVTVYPAGSMASGYSTISIVENNKQPTGKNDGVWNISNYGYWLDDDDNLINIYTNKAQTFVNPGKTMYYPLLVNGAPTNGAISLGDVVSKTDAQKSAKASVKYTLGQSYISSIKVEYKKFRINDSSSTAYGYFLAITAKSNTNYTSQDFAADINLKKSSGDYAFDYKVRANFEIKYEQVVSDYLVEKDYKTFDLRDEDGEQTFDFDEFDGAYFEVDVTGQNRILIKADTKYDAKVASLYPAANIDFFNGYDATFNKIGELRVPAEYGSYIYRINADGSLSKVSNCSYDDGEECFVIRTRTLGYYAIADTELDISKSQPSSTVVDGPSDPPTPTPTPGDPGTNYKPSPNTGAKA